MRRLLAGLLMLPCLAMAAEEQRFNLPLFKDGLHTRYSANAIPDGALAESLNVVIDEDVDGVVVARRGYAKYNTTAITDEKSVRGLWTFDATDGTKYLVAFSSSSFYKSAGDGSWTLITGATGYSSTKDFDCVQAIGKFWCANGDTVFYWDGTSTKTVSGAPLGNLIDKFRNRVLISGISGEKGRVKGSGELDGEDWTVQTSVPLISSTPISIAFGGANDGEEVTCLMGAYQDVFIVGKRNSLGGLYGFDRRDFGVRELSREVGCIDDRSVREKNNCLYWLSLRGVERFCGTSIERVSDPVRDQIDTIIATAGNPRSAVDTSQSDFEAGNLSASGAGAPVSATISPGNVVPSSWSATENSTTSWLSGTLVNVSTAIPGQLTFIQGDNASFTNAGAESNSSVNFSSLTAGIQSRDVNPDNHTGPIYGSRSWRMSGGNNIPCPWSFLISLTGDDGVVYYSSNVSIDNLSVTVTSYLNIDTSTFPVKMLTLRAYGDGYSGALAEAISVPFVRGKHFPLAIIRTLGGGNCTIKWDVDESDMVTSGTYTTQRYNTSFSTPTWGTFTASVSSPSQSSVLLQTQVSATSSGGLDSAVNVSLNERITSAQKQYILAFASFTVNSTTNTPPYISSLGLQAATTGYFISQCRNPGTAITAWGVLGCNTVANGGDISIAVATGATCNAATRSTATWNSHSNNTFISIATAPYVAYRLLFSVDSGTETPTAQDCTINWTEGASRPPVSSAIYRDRYYLAYTSSTASDAKNDHLLVLDKNDKWTLFDKHNCYSMSLYERKLYCGASTSTGLVWKLDTGTDDDGAAILSRIRTKAFHFGMPEARKTYSRLYLDLEPAPDASYNIDLTARYTLDRGTTTHSFGAVDLGEDLGYILTPKFPFPLTGPVDGRYLQVELESNGLNQPWRLYGGRLYFTPIRKE